MPISLKDAFEGIRDQVDDLLTLDVVTLTGSIEVVTDAEGKIDLSQIYEAIEAQAKTSGALKVVAFTHLSADMDTVQFVKENLSEGERPLHEAHVGTLVAAQEARNAFLRTVKDVVGL